jgi:hypothetical protein
MFDCKQLCADMLTWRITTPDVSIPRIFFFWMASPVQFIFSVSQCTCDIIMAICCMNSTIRNLFLSQETVLTYLVGGQRLFEIFWLVWWMCVLPLWLLFGFNIHKWNPCFITCFSYDVIEKFISIFVVSLFEGVKAEAVLYIFCALLSISGTNVAQNLW